MPRVLTVDDSRAIRTIVSKHVTEMGFEIEEAEDGNEGLKKLQGAAFDLVLLDVTMPNLDGPGMLAKMREGGDKTPVLMLTSESKTSIVSALMKLGIEDFILKPFKPEELRAKLTKVLKLDAAALAAAKPAGERPEPATPTAAPVPSPQGAAVSARGKVDILVVDDMENVHKKLRSLIPNSVAVDGCLNGNEALALCRVRSYRLVLVDTEIPGVEVTGYVKQLRLLQPEATYLGMALRSANNLNKEVRALGFDDVLVKPFTPEAIDDLVSQHLAGSEQLLGRDENVLRMAPFHGRADRVDAYFTRLQPLLAQALEAVAGACYDEAILDVSFLPVTNDVRAGKFVIEAVALGERLGVSMVLVASPGVAQVLKKYQETKDLPCHPTVEAARSASAA